jgi:hypothetical protein
MSAGKAYQPKIEPQLRSTLTTKDTATRAQLTLSRETNKTRMYTGRR